MKLTKTFLFTTLFAFSTPLFTANAFANDSNDFDQAVALYDKGNYHQAFAIFKRLAEKGNSDAQFNIGLMYKKGQGVKQDYHQAAKWYKKAEEQGNINAQSNLGIMHALGQGVKMDKRKAKYYFGLACDNGNQKGCNNYKLMVEEGY